MPYVWSSLAKSVSGSACAGAANIRAGAIAAAAIEANRIPVMTLLSNWTRWVFISWAASPYADRSFVRVPRRRRPWHRLRPGSHFLGPPEPPSHHCRDRWRHERPDHQCIEQQAETDRRAHLTDDDEVADHHRHHGEREHQAGRRHHRAGAGHGPDDAVFIPACISSLNLDTNNRL